MAIMKYNYDKVPFCALKYMHKWFRTMVKVKVSHYEPGQALRASGG
jgi:hypothetical protein